MTTHKMKAWAPFGLQPDALECMIEYTYAAGSHAVYYGTPQPADPASVDFVSVKCVHALSGEMQAMLDEWAGEWLSEDYGRAKALDNLDDDR